MNNIQQKVSCDIGETQYSDWILVDQAMIDRFADATCDRQFIHIDPVRAAETPFGGTVAHGFLTVALLPSLYAELDEAANCNAKMMVNYGFDRLRFVHPVRAASRIRASFTLTEYSEKRPGQYQQSHEVVVEIEGEDKPALVATWVTQYFV